MIDIYQARILWESYGPTVIAGGAGLATLAAVGLYAKRKLSGQGGALKRAGIWLSTNIALLFNAEGMFIVMRDRAHVPLMLTLVLFMVFVTFLLRAEAMVAEKFRATTKRDRSGRITKPGVLGMGVSVMWAVGLGEAVVASWGADNLAVVLLRFIIPSLVILLFLTDLKSEVTVERRGSFAYSPRRLMERYGLLTSGVDVDLERLKRDRRIAKMVKLVDLMDSGDVRATRKFRKIARGATAAEMKLVGAQIERTREMLERFAPKVVKDVIKAEIVAEPAPVYDYPWAIGPALPPVEGLSLADVLPINGKRLQITGPRPSRATRIDWDAEDTARRIINGEGQEEIRQATGVSKTSYYRFARVVAMLKSDPGQSIPETERVSPEHVAMIRELLKNG